MVEVLRRGKWEVEIPVGNDDRFAKFREPGESTAPWWTFHRNYDSFALMANVRNNGDTVPIDEPRGLPADVTAEAARELAFGGDFHSHSWLTLAEIKKALNPKKMIREAGIMSEADFKRWRERKIAPDSYCQGIGGGGVKVVSGDEMVDIWKGRAHRHLQMQYQVRAAWERPVRQGAGELFRFMKRIEKLGSGNKVRVVFAFDN